MQSVSPLKRTTEVVEHREGGDASVVQKSPGQTRYEPITLKRGVTHDKAFEQWANKVWNIGGEVGKEVSLVDFRKDIRIVLLNEAGQAVMAYDVFDCWVSEYVALPELDANENKFAYESIKLQNQGWKRDYDVKESNQPQFTEPQG